MKTTLILGIGNDILTDDGIGPKIVNAFRTVYKFPEYHLETTSLGGLEILEMIKDYEKVIIIDAIITKDGIPGSVYHFTPDDFRETLHLSNLHDTNFLVALELGRKLEYNLPVSIQIIAIEIIEDRVFSDRLSPEIEKKYSKIYESVEKIMREILVDV